MDKNTDFHVILTEDPIDGGYIVTVPEIPEIVTEGNTIEECMKMAKDAIETYLAHKKEVKTAVVKILPKNKLNLPASA